MPDDRYKKLLPVVLRIFEMFEFEIPGAYGIRPHFKITPYDFTLKITPSSLFRFVSGSLFRFVSVCFWFGLVVWFGG